MEQLRGARSTVGQARALTDQSRSQPPSPTRCRLLPAVKPLANDPDRQPHGAGGAVAVAGAGRWHHRAVRPADRPVPPLAWLAAMILVACGPRRRRSGCEQAMPGLQTARQPLPGCTCNHHSTSRGQEPGQVHARSPAEPLQAMQIDVADLHHPPRAAPAGTRTSPPKQCPPWRPHLKPCTARRGAPCCKPTASTATTTVVRWVTIIRVPGMLGPAGRGRCLPRPGCDRS